MKKRLLGILLTLTMVTGLLTGLTLTAGASETSGTCGDNITWSYDTDTKTITFSGTGETKHYNSGDTREWNEYIDDIENVVIGYGITYLGTAFLSGHPSLKNISLSETVKTIWVSAFSNCDSLQEVYIPGNVESISGSAFSGCDNLEKVHIAEGLEGISTRAFQSCNSIKAINIPDSVETISSLALAYCENLENVFIGSSVTSIKDDAFKNSNKISAVYINCTSDEWSEKGLGTAFFPDTALIYYTDTDGVVRFDANGGYCDTLFTTVNDENKIASLPVPEKPYATFDGWYDAETGGNEITTDTEFTAAATVYAHWNNRAKVTFEVNGGVCDIRSLYADENGKLASLPEITKDRCSFEGWYDAETDGTRITTETVFSEDTTVYAYWSTQALHKTEWTGYCKTENKARFDIKDYLPADTVIANLQCSLPLVVGTSQSITYTSNVNDAYTVLNTKAFENPASDVYVITVNTSNYGTVTIQATINLIDFEIESYDATENSACISIPLEGEYSLIFADYDGEKLNDIEVVKLTVTADNVGKITQASVKGITLGTGDKIMLWADAAGFTPMCEEYIVK